MACKTTSGEENLYFELESVKKENEAGIYEDVAVETAVESVVTPATKQMNFEEDTQGTKRKRKSSVKREDSYQSDAVVIRRLVIISAAVAAVALLTAVTTLILALTILMSRKDWTAASIEVKDYGALYAELKEMKQNISDIKSLTDDKMSKGQNTTDLWLAIQKAVNTSVDGKLLDIQQQIIRLDQKVMNTSTVRLLKGPPGYNGTQGPPGPPGPPGSSNLSFCSYKNYASPGTRPDVVYATQWIAKTESDGVKFLGAYCDTNDAKIVTFSSTASAGKRTYKCDCKGGINSGASTMYCYIHYWECPV